MSEVPPAAPGGEPVDEASNETTKGGEGSQVGEGRPGGEQPQPEGSAPAEWWRVHPQPPTVAAQPTPPAGTPPFGVPYAGTTPPPGTTPPWSVPGWGAPPWAGPPQWYGWGPGWPGGPPQPPPGPSSSTPARRHPLPWVIVGAVLTAMALVALGVGIGFSVWGGGSAPAAARSGPTVPLPHVGAPFFGRGGFLGVEVRTAGPAATSSSSAVTTSGAYVVSVVATSPAAKAGIVKGDTITEFATKTVASVPALEADVLATAPETHVKVGWVTSTGKHESATVTLASRADAGARSLG